IALELLWRRGVDDPHQHLIVLQNFEVATLLLSPTPFAKHDLDAMQEAAVEMGFTMLATPRRGPLHEGLLAQLWAIDNQAELWTWTANQELDLTPPTDDRPFFFNTLKPQTWLANPETADDLDVAFLGNLQATQ